MEGCPCQDGRFLRFEFYTLDSVYVRRFDIITFDFTGPEDEPGLLQSRENVNKLIEQEINEDIPSNRVVVGGFSQGGSMTLVAGLTSPHRFAGLTVLSGWFAIRGKVKEVWGSLTSAAERFDKSLAASRAASNYHPHLLGTRCGRPIGPAVNR